VIGFLLILQADTTLYRNQDSIENLLNFSQGFSATHFEVPTLPDWFSPLQLSNMIILQYLSCATSEYFQGKPAFQKHFSFFESSYAEKPASEEAGAWPTICALDLGSL
jgi:hypothetical protein